MPVSLALVVHAHQPIGNFDSVIEDAYKTSYHPFIQAAEQYPDLRLTMHFSGSLLDWIRQRHPEYLERLKALVQAGRLELLSGGYFEPILVSIPDRDKNEQIGRLSDYIEQHLGTRPRGIWLTERVWEPELPAALADAGVEYAVIDDTHFLMAGLEPEQTYGYYTSEHQGRVVQLVPSNKLLRHQIPFRPEQEAISFMHEVANRYPGSLLTMGDDLEKFGSWPHTYAHVYKDRWLARFFDAVAHNREWLETATLRDYIDSHAPLGMVYLPTASYAEMMQWALPTQAAAAFQRALEDAATEPYRRFLAGAPWRSFLAKYGEANYLHKSMLDLSARFQRYAERRSSGLSAERTRARTATSGGSTPADVHEQGYTHLLAAQCNDAYWHGLFGGLYAPHLRDTVYTHLLAADRLLEELEGPSPLRCADIDLDRREEIVLRNSFLRTVIRTAGGGTVEELDFRPANANLINSLQRRPEVYHEKIRNRVAAAGEEFPSQSMTSVKEEGLELALQYDRYPRTCGRVYLFHRGKTRADFERLSLDERTDVADGEYTMLQADPQRPADGVLLEKQYEGGRLRKRYKLLELEEAGASELECGVDFGERGIDFGLSLGVEMVLNLLAPTAEDRAFIHDSRRDHLSWSGEATGPRLELVDGWRQIRILLHAPDAETWWVRPIYTVSQSEGGFERVYQGSAIMAVWRKPARSRSVNIRVEPIPRGGKSGS